MKVFPEEVEAVLSEHPSVELVRVYGVAHPVLGFYPEAVYVLKNGSNPISFCEMREFCAKQLAPYKIPMLMKQVASIELTASGKVKRY